MFVIQIPTVLKSKTKLFPGRASPIDVPAATGCAESIEDVEDEDVAFQEAIRLSQMEANMTEEQRRKREEEELEQVCPLVACGAAWHIVGTG